MVEHEEQPDAPPSESGWLRSTFSRRWRDSSPVELPRLKLPARFQIKRQLGRGGMGAVYLAYDRRGGHDVALKVLHGFGAADRLKLKQEFRSLSGIVHPNLVDLHELFIDEYVCFFTMEYVHGLDLATRGKQLVTEHEDGLERAAHFRSLALQLALALHALHEGGKLHRDIKPSNVLVTQSDRVVLLDFGLVSSLASRKLGSSSENGIEGTVLYMSPEQLWGHGTTEASDWYSYGITLREALTGAPPTRVDLLAKGERQSLRERGFDVPEELDHLITSLLANEPGQRPGFAEILHCLGGTAAAMSGRSSIPPPPSPPSLVGREPLLESLRQLQREATGTRVVVRVSGPSGIGKSALMRQLFVDLESEPGVLLLKSRCHPNEAVAFNALDGFIDELSRELKHDQLFHGGLEPEELQAVSQVFPVLAQAIDADLLGGPLLINDRDKRQLATDALCKILNRISAKRQLVIWLDDVQWGDTDSGRLLRNLLRAQHCPPMLLLLSYREQDGEASACLNELLQDTELWQSSRLLSVGPLDEEQSTELLNKISGEHWQNDPSGRERLLRWAAGSPFFLTEVAGYLAMSKSDPTQGLGMDELWRFRIQGLSRESQRVLEVLAVAGAPLERETLLSAARLESAQRGLLADLEQISVVRTVDVERYRIEFYHDKFREEMMRMLTDDVRMAHHRAIAQAVLSTTAPNPLAALEHFEAAGDLDSVRRYIVTAANHALKLLAFERAARLYQRAIELESGELALHELYRRLGSALGSAGRGKEAAKAFSTAADLLKDQEGESSEQLIHLQQAAAEQFIQTGHFQQGTEMIREVLSALDVPFPKSRGQALRKALQLRALSLLWGVKPTKRKQPPAPIELRRFDALWSADTRLSMVDYALCNYATIRCVQYALKLGDPSRMSRALAMEAAFCSTLPQPIFQKRAAALHHEACELAKDPRATRYDTTFCKATRAVISFYSGRFRETNRMADESIAELPPGRSWELGPWVMWSLIGLTWSGQIAELIRRVRSLRERAAQLGDQQLEQNISLGPPAIAWLALDNAEEALRRADAALSWAPSTYTAQHYEHYVTSVDCDLYLGRGLSAWRRTAETWPSHKREFFLALTFIRDDLLRTRGRAALAAVLELDKSGRSRTDTGDNRGALLKAAAHAAREMRLHRLDGADGFAGLIEAGLARVNGDTNRVNESLHNAATSFAKADMQLYEYVARYFLEDSGGASEVWMREQGIIRPARFAAMIAPGLSPLDEAY